MYIKIRKNEGYTVVAILNSEIDRNILNLFRTALRNLLSNNNSKVIIDMHNVNEVNNKFLGCLLAFGKKFDTVGCELSICSVKAELLSIFYIIKLDKYLKIYSNEYDISHHRLPLIKRRFKIV